MDTGPRSSPAESFRRRPACSAKPISITMGCFRRICPGLRQLNRGWKAAPTAKNVHPPI